MGCKRPHLGCGKRHSAQMWRDIDSGKGGSREGPWAAVGHPSDPVRPAPANLGSEVAPFSTLIVRRRRGANGLLNWFQQAACKGKTDPFFSSHPGDVARARKLCGDCPVRSECLDLAMSDLNLQGVWAGLTAQERQKLRWGRVA